MAPQYSPECFRVRMQPLPIRPDSLAASNQPSFFKRPTLQHLQPRRMHLPINHGDSAAPSHPHDAHASPATLSPSKAPRRDELSETSQVVSDAGHA
ncbi:hypothetical protein CDD82_1354 [Ophiocordyceps australis]|uniref:Uncharacterized protein n=1 Tax=Ophiocordyceps australis TaxID=1399860 RepID=A0A2C5YSH2_9HYPO|nr:hypothetical protein CDD82_1354 [Ophiocordyceps australis]